MASTDKPEDNTWYRNGWVWLLLGIPGASIILSLTMVYIAISGRDSLVRDDYYKDGLAINADLTRQQEARMQQIQARIDIRDDGSLELSFENTLREEPAWLRLQFSHPTLANQDFELKLIRDGARFAGQFPEASVPEGRWYVQLSDAANTWMVQDELRLPSPSVLLSATES